MNYCLKTIFQNQLNKQLHIFAREINASLTHLSDRETVYTTLAFGELDALLPHLGATKPGPKNTGMAEGKL